MTSDIILIIIGGMCVIAGVVGCILPVLPGPLLTYSGLLVLQLSSAHPFTVRFLIIYAVLTGLAALLDYIIPIYGTKKLEGSKYGIWGSTVGLIAGLFFFPAGIILGPVLGAFIGELISGKTKKRAFKSALGSFLGFLTGAAVKVVLSLSMAFFYASGSYHFFVSR